MLLLSTTITITAIIIIINFNGNPIKLCFHANCNLIILLFICSAYSMLCNIHHTDTQSQRQRNKNQLRVILCTNNNNYNNNKFSLMRRNKTSSILTTVIDQTSNQREPTYLPTKLPMLIFACQQQPQQTSNNLSSLHRLWILMSYLYTQCLYIVDSIHTHTHTRTHTRTHNCKHLPYARSSFRRDIPFPTQCHAAFQ